MQLMAVCCRRGGLNYWSENSDKTEAVITSLTNIRYKYIIAFISCSLCFLILAEWAPRQGKTLSNVKKTLLVSKCRIIPTKVPDVEIPISFILGNCLYYEYKISCSSSENYTKQVTVSYEKNYFLTKK